MEYLSRTGGFESKALIDSGFAMLKELVKTTPEEEWSAEIETPFFWFSLHIEVVLPHSFP